MSRVYLSICLCCLQFLLSVSYSFLFIGLLLRLLPRYFILFDAGVNVILFSLLLVYRNAADFYRLIFYPTSLLNSLVSSNRFFGGMFRILYIEYHVFFKY